MSKTTLTDANFSSLNAVGNTISVEFGQVSGQICMEIICPIQSLICWEVQVDKMPDLVVIPIPNISCTAVDLGNRFQG